MNSKQKRDWGWLKGAGVLIGLGIIMELIIMIRFGWL